MPSLSCSIPESYAEYLNKVELFPENHSWPYKFDLTIKSGYNLFNFNDYMYLTKNSIIRYFSREFKDIQLPVDKSGSMYSDYFHNSNLLKISENNQNWRYYIRTSVKINRQNEVNSHVLKSYVFKIWKCSYL